MRIAERVGLDDAPLVLVGVDTISVVGEGCNPVEVVSVVQHLLEHNWPMTRWGSVNAEGRSLVKKSNVHAECCSITSRSSRQLSQ